MSCNYLNDYSTLFSSIKQEIKKETHISTNAYDLNNNFNFQGNNSFIYLILYVKELMESGLYDHSLRILKNDVIKSVFLNSIELKSIFNCIQLGISKLHLFQLVSNGLIFQYNTDISLLNEEFIDIKNEIDYNTKMKYMIIGKYFDVLQSLFYQNHLEPLLKNYLISSMDYIMNNIYDNDYMTKINQMTIDKINFEDIILYYQSAFTYYSEIIKPKSITNDLELESKNFLMNINPDIFINNVDHIKEENFMEFIINKFINDEIINNPLVNLKDLKVNLNISNSNPGLVPVSSQVTSLNINNEKFMERDLYIKDYKGQIDIDEILILKKNLINQNDEEIFISHNIDKYQNQYNEDKNEIKPKKDKYFLIKKLKKQNIFDTILIENKLKLTKKNRKLSIMNKLCFKGVKREKIDRYMIKYFTEFIQSDRKFNCHFNPFLKFLYFNKLKFPFIWNEFQFKSENTSFLIFFFSHEDLYDIYDGYVSLYYEYINENITELYKNNMSEFEINQIKFYIMNFHKIYSLNYK